jgi:predicted amidophosphoribosyltransferase
VNIFDLLLPARCAVCASGGKPLCDGCRQSLPLLRGSLCQRCGAPTAWPVTRCAECSGRRLAFASARAAVEYDERVRSFVAAWKEHGLRRLATDAAALVVEVIPPPGVALVLRRGHHPAERLARALGEHWELPVRPLLAWARAIPHQRGLSLPERRRNVAGAFRPAARAPSRVALVDDVYTSGATAAAAASALRKAGARRVEVVTFARVVR